LLMDSRSMLLVRWLQLTFPRTSFGQPLPLPPLAPPEPSHAPANKHLWTRRIDEK
jgi:hypothetical protein